MRHPRRTGVPSGTPPLRDLLVGDFRMGSIYVRSDRRVSETDIERVFRIARSQQSLATASEFGSGDLLTLTDAVNLMHDIVHAMCGTDDVDFEEFAAWMQWHGVEWLGRN